MLVGQQIGPFAIEKEIGSGAMGTVYLARFQKNDEKNIPVALKMVALGLLGNEGAMARFTREAEILKQLRHPHIVRLIATGAWRKTPFIAMEFIDGEALDKVLARRGRLTWEEVVTYGKQLCEALQYAHEKGIIHRDLKPSNLMINREGVLKLTDFGIAKDTDVTALTGANSTIGTAAYMSPEQCKGDRNLTNKSDLYSLGIVLFELLSGKKPFYADNSVEMFIKHTKERPPRIGKLVPDLPPKLESLVLQLLEKDKESRPTDAAWVGRMFREVEDDAFARKSAGLDAATARRVDRPRSGNDPPIDESDRAAARALKGGTSKKRKLKKRAADPWYTRTWAKAAGLTAALLVLVGGAYLAVKPASADSLYAAIKAAESPDAKLDAAEKYLKTYGDTPGEKTDEAARLFREGKVRERDKQMANRLARGMAKPEDSDDPEAFSAAWEAMQAEKAGDLRRATDSWTRVRDRFPDEGKLSYTLDDAKLAKAKWTWLADKRLRDIKDVDEKAARLKKEIRDMRVYETPLKYAATSPEGLAVKAFRLDEFGDREKAGRVWESLITLTEKDSDQRSWYLLGCQMKALVPKEVDDPTKKRIGLIVKTLAEADTTAQVVKADPDRKAERSRVRQLCREVTELYDDEPNPDIVDKLGRAKKIAAEVPKS